MTELVERLRDYAGDDHERLCQGRNYDCTCGYDERRDPLIAAAADELTALTAKVALLTEALRPFDGLATVVLSEAPPNADFIIVYTDSSGKKWAMRLDELRDARRALSEPDKDAT